MKRIWLLVPLVVIAIAFTRWPACELWEYKANGVLVELIYGTTVKAPTFQGNLTGNVTGDVTGAVTGNAATATTATNVSGGTVSGTTGTFSDLLTLRSTVSDTAGITSATADGGSYFHFKANAYTSPASAATVAAGQFEYNWYKGDNANFVAAALEGVARSKGPDESATLRGVYGRFYIDPDANASSTLRTGIAGEFSARAGYSGAPEIVAESGTAFVGERIWMAPWFADSTLSNINNFHALWIYNEHTSADVTNAIYVSSAGGSFTNFFNFNDGSGNNMGLLTKTGKLTVKAARADSATLTSLNLNLHTIATGDSVIGRIILDASDTTLKMWKATGWKALF